MKKKNWKQKHNEFVDEILDGMKDEMKHYWNNVYKKPKFWLFYLLAMATIYLGYYLGTLYRN